MAIEVRTGALVAAVIGVSAACAGAPPAPQPTPFTAACIVVDADAPPELRIVLGHDVRPRNAPVPRNASETFIFGQLYEPLIRIDCEGRAVPALATSWTADATGRAWEFTLREVAFDDGVLLTPALVVEAWSATGAVVFDDIDSDDVGIVRTSGGGRVLRVELTAGVNASWFARPELAVTRAGDGWPHGTGAYRVRADTERGTLQLDARESGRHTPGTIAVRLVPGADTRAPLDAGTDLLSTHDPPVLEYARALGGYVTVPAGWSRTYVLAARGTAVETVAASDLLLPAGARAAEPLMGWSAAECRLGQSLPHLPSAPAGTRTARVIAYPRGDVVAQANAERLAALAWPTARSPAWLTAALGPLPSDPPVVESMTDAALADALRAGALLAAVLPVPRSPVADCAGLSLSALPAVEALMQSDWQVTPLIDVPLHLLHRQPPGRLLLDAHGVLRFDGGTP